MVNNLRRIDLNLLVTLHALLIEKHISRAAVRLHKSQPAVSHALAHLRQLFDDPLLVRRGGKLELTSRAAELFQPLTEALGQLGTLLDTPQFDPSSTQRVFRLAMSDYGARVVLPGLVPELRAAAPGVELRISQSSREAMLADVMEGQVDMALGVFADHAPSEVHRHTLFREHFACLADASTVPACSALSLPDWLARPHVMLAMRSTADNEVDQALARAGHQRQIAVQLPHWGVASDLIAGTDLILTVARRSLDAVARDPRLSIFEPPLCIEPFDFSLIWHRRRDGDQAHGWLRQLLMVHAAR